MVEWAVVEWKAVVAQFKEDVMDIDIIRYFGASYVMESELTPKEKCDMIDYVKEAEWDQILNLVFNGSKPTRKLTINEQYILEAQAENFIYPLILRYISEADGKKKTKTKAKTKTKVKTKPKGKGGLKFSVSGDTGEMYTDIKRKAGETYQSTRKTVTRHGPALRRYAKGGSVVVLVAAATAAAHRLFKIYLSKAARQCGELSGPEKRNCIVKFKKGAYQVKVNAYMKARSDCAKTKNPQKCQQALDTKIKKVRYKMGTLYSRL